MPVDNLIHIIIALSKSVIKPDDSLEDRCRAAMKAAHANGIVTDEELQFKGAVAAVFVESTDEDEKERIRLELETLRDLSALLSGVPVDLEAIQPLENPIGLRKLWVEVTK
jgi:hypothetical protein